MTHVPEHMIPDEPAVIGTVSVGPALSDEDRRNAVPDPALSTDTPTPSIDDLPECPDCECPLVGCLDAKRMTCPECGVELDSPAERERQRREERERQRWNDRHSFHHLSPSEWREYKRRGGDRR